MWRVGCSLLHLHLPAGFSFPLPRPLCPTLIHLLSVVTAPASLEVPAQLAGDVWFLCPFSSPSGSSGAPSPICLQQCWLTPSRDLLRRIRERGVGTAWERVFGGLGGRGCHSHHSLIGGTAPSGPLPPHPSATVPRTACPEIRLHGSQAPRKESI